MWSTSFYLLGLTAAAYGKITISVSDVEPLQSSPAGSVLSANDLFHQSCPEEVAIKNPYKANLLLSSYTELDSTGGQVLENTYPSSDSFVRGSIVAWANHEGLVLRPDVIWFEILAQLNFYMTKNAESIRHLFVDFEGKEEIKVYKNTWENVIASFGQEIQMRVKTSWLLGWITPGFSTSTHNDNMTATVLMMGLMQHYFEFSGGITCGIPSVTLLGTRDDWVKLYRKLDRLQEWGAEPTQYAINLKPILSRFVQTWDKPNSPAIKSFWEQIVRAKQRVSCGGPAEYDLSGWITGFLHWREDGTLRNPFGSMGEERATKLDNITYTHVDVSKIPVGYAKAPLKMLDYPRRGEDTMAYVLAGNIGIKRTKNGTKGFLAEPLNSWFLYGPVKENFTTGPEYGNFSDVGDIARSLRMWCPSAALRYG